MRKLVITVMVLILALCVVTMSACDFDTADNMTKLEDEGYVTIGLDTQDIFDDNDSLQGLGNVSVAIDVSGLVPEMLIVLEVESITDALSLLGELANDPEVIVESLDLDNLRSLADNNAELQSVIDAIESIDQSFFNNIAEDFDISNLSIKGNKIIYGTDDAMELVK